MQNWLTDWQNRRESVLPKFWRILLLKKMTRSAQSAWVEQVWRLNAAKLARPVPISVAQFHDSTNASTIIISHCRFQSVTWFYKCFKRIIIYPFQSRDSTNASTIIISDCRVQSHDSTILQKIAIISLSLIADFRSTIPRFYNCFNNHHIETWRKQRMESDPKCRFPGRIESNSKITATQTDGFCYCFDSAVILLEEQTSSFSWQIRRIFEIFLKKYSRKFPTNSFPGWKRSWFK